MIPKIIHYFWLGPNPLPPEERELIKGWKEVMPDFEIRHWGNEDIPQGITYVNHALEQKKYANAVNFLRLYALYLHGGIYFDTDIEVVKSLEPLLQKQFFIGRQPEQDGHVTVNNAVIGAEAGDPFLLECMFYQLAYFSGNELAHLSGPLLVTSRLKAAITRHPNHQFSILPATYFYPYGWFESFSPACITSDTYTIHHWAMTWVDEPVLSFIDRLTIQVERLKKVGNYLINGRKRTERIQLIEPVLQLAVNLGVSDLSIDTGIPASDLIEQVWQRKRRAVKPTRKLIVTVLEESSSNLIKPEEHDVMICYKTDGVTDFNGINCLKSRAEKHGWLCIDYHHVLNRDIDENIEDDRFIVVIPEGWLG